MSQKGTSKESRGDSGLSCPLDKQVDKNLDTSASDFHQINEVKVQREQRNTENG